MWRSLHNLNFPNDVIHLAMGAFNEVTNQNEKMGGREVRLEPGNNLCKFMDNNSLMDTEF